MAYLGYMMLIIRKALEEDQEARIYDWYVFPGILETVIEYSNGVIAQHWTYV